MKRKFVSTGRIVALVFLLAGVIAAGCSSDDKKTSRFGAGPAKMAGTPAALTPNAARVLGFENGPADWTLVSGSSNDRTEGTVSGAVNVTGWMQITSVPLSSIAQNGVVIGDSAAIDVKLPVAANWGEVRLILDLPSKGIWWKDLGGTRLQDLSPGAFSEVTFTLPPEVSTALSGVYSDLKLIVIINGPVMGAPVLLDNLRFAGVPVDSDTAIGDGVSFGFVLPENITLETVVVGVSSSLRLADAVHAENVVANVVNMGTGLTDIGADGEVDGNVIAHGDVQVRDRTVVHGEVRATGAINLINGAYAENGTFPNSSVNDGETVEWSVTWPVVNGVVVVTENPDPANPGHSIPFELAPGAYTSVEVQNRADLVLRSGTYFFDRFMAEPEGTIHLNETGEPIIVYVRDSLVSRAALVHSHSSADFMMAFDGVSVVELDGPFAGTVVAPKTTIRLAPLNGGSHEGSFFAARVDAEAQTPVKLVSYGHWDDLIDECPFSSFKTHPGICGCMYRDDDDDSDGFANCEEICDNDPNKQDPGITGCGYSDDADMDSDSIPDKTDPIVNDGDNIYSHQCDDAADGTPCNDGVCGGIHVCNNGECGDPSACLGECGAECKQFPDGDKTYLICNCKRNRGQASNYCDDEEGGKLLRIRSMSENLQVTRFLNSMGLTEAWMGANDLETEGKWYWPSTSSFSSKLFWVGDANGKAHFTSVAAWATGEPAGEGDCGVLKADGTWREEVCLVEKPFICEIPGQTLKGDGGSPYDMVDTDSDGGSGGGPGSGGWGHAGGIMHVGIPAYGEPTNCAPENYEPLDSDDDIFLGSDFTWPAEDPLRQKYEDCVAIEKESDYLDAGCDDLPGGEVPTGNNCPPWDGDTQLSNTDDFRHTFFPTANCRLGEFAAFEEIAISSFVTETVPRACERNADCADINNAYCGKVFACCQFGAGGSCKWNDAEVQYCDPADSSTCGNYPCVAMQACGLVTTDDQARCVDDGADDPDLCGYEELCTPEDEMVIGNSSVPSDRSFDDIREKPEDLQGDLPDEEPAEDNAPYDNADFEYTCDGEGCGELLGSHPWCNYDVAAPPAEDVSSTENSHANQDSGQEGNNEKLIQFAFSPDFNWDYDVTPGPFGMFVPNLSAEAGVSAGVNLIDVFGGNATVDLIDAQLYLRLGLSYQRSPGAHKPPDDEAAAKAAALCGLKTQNAEGLDSRIEILSMNLLPDSMQGFKFPKDDETHYECVKAVQKLEDTVDRTKKAMRDAQALILQYREMAQNGMRFDRGVLCDYLLQRLIQEKFVLPPEFEAHAQRCDPTTPKELMPTPEETINLFIDYYMNVAYQQIEPAIVELIEKTKNVVPAAGEADGDVRKTDMGGMDRAVRVDIVSWGDEKEKTLFNQNFMIGPVPCNLEVFLSMAYGFDVDASFSFSPADMLANLIQPDGGGSGSKNLADDSIASMALHATPYAAARVGLFVGAGFDFGFAAIKVGIDGIVSIGEISVPATATLGLAFRSEPDTREVTGPQAELAALDRKTGEVVLMAPPRKFQLSLVYGADVTIDITDVLAGSVGVKLKLKFLFFSKSWRKQIAKWKGLCSSEVPWQDRQSWCHIPLLSVGGTLAEIPMDFAWANIKMPTPFLALERLSDYVPGDAPLLPVNKGSKDYDDFVDEMTHSAGELLYDAQCDPIIVE